MRGKGVKVAEPSDPFHDDDFIHALMQHLHDRPHHRLDRVPRSLNARRSDRLVFDEDKEPSA